ncbi:50S ribosomal protein L4 [Cylindrospermopsis raciborskii CENA303]|uniref:Large ribosomal subunit protein uL4 n=1 Tax=Cylindrospermopsis raciborskii CENA303 TaxID=1170769 RepID=A0A1X4GB12_9CYAN|nr:50S ribosomal protein L4 [Cylindrospermopsis raciborskii]EFA71792.1 Ribosomal protein L4/L1e [Raphidiopsis brookii D9]OSO94359.1 50S ribosomal protein L4 [Cylindrospermopsis raciborskii CENA303]
MVESIVKNWQGEEVGQTSFELRIAKEETASHIVHRALVRQMTNSRQGTASTKTRAEVRGGGRKPWRQKGTGRARAGSIRSPLWRGGGVIFGPKPRDFNIKLNRKERRLALRTAFVSRREDLIVVEEFTDQLQRPKSKELVAALARWGATAEQKTLLILSEIGQSTETISLSARNVENIKVIAADQLNVFDLLHADKIVVTSSALNKIQEVYSA